MEKSIRENSTPLYQVIIDSIKSRIAAHDFDYDTPICTEKNLCEQFSVSRITAKHALKQLEADGLLYRKRGVGSFVVRVDEAEAATNLTHKIFALLIPFGTTRGGIFSAVESASSIFTRLGHQLTIHISHSLRRDSELLKKLLSQGVGGVVYYPRTSEMPTDDLNAFAQRDIPVIILDKPHQFSQFGCVACDNYSGGQLLAEHLLKYGHKNTCYLSRFTPDELTSIAERYAGYSDYISANHTDAQPRFVCWENSEQTGYPMLKHIVNTLLQDGITAILCENDEVAFQVYLCCRSLDVRVPEDISITGFDNIDWSVTGSAQITTIDQNFPGIGECIANALLNEDGTVIRRRVPVQLVPRNSTGRVLVGAL